LEKAYASPDSQFLKLSDGTRIHYRDLGPKDAPAIILVHGFSASLHTWEDWTESLKADYRVISLDLPGHGLSRCLAAEDVSVEQFVDVVDQTATHLGAQSFTLVGSSMGGHTAWSYALKFPEKLDALVLVGASGWPKAEGDDDNGPLVFKLLEYRMARALMKDIDMSGLIRSGLEDSFVDQSFVTDTMVQRYSSLSRAPCHREAILSLTRARSDRQVATTQALSQITIPTLILHGTDDNLVPVSAAEKFKTAIPHASVQIYERVGHVPQEEVANESLIDLKAFLDTHLKGDEPEAMEQATPVNLETIETGRN
jgi:pimeloyl-ACP methyl ester carboxylesterase